MPKNVFYLTCFSFAGLKVTKNLVFLDGTVQHTSTEIAMQWSFKYNNYILVLIKILLIQGVLNLTKIFTLFISSNDWQPTLNF